MFVYFPPDCVKYNNLHVDVDADVKAVYRLKELVPSVCVKDNVSQLDVILEAIRYIASLQVSFSFVWRYLSILLFVDIFPFCLGIPFLFFCLPLSCDDIINYLIVKSTLF